MYFSMTPPLLLLGFLTTMKGSIPPLSAKACSHLKKNKFVHEHDEHDFCVLNQDQAKRTFL
jgi:hypothetical protein